MKYPRTYHLPWSPGVSADDRMMKTPEIFIGQSVIITEKMDGENTTGHSNGNVHARSLTSSYHSSRTWVNRFLAQKMFDLPEGWRVCGENLYAKHSIWYDNLDSYFLGFSIWDETNKALSWDETLEWFEILGIKSVPVLWSGVLDSVEFLRNFHESLDLQKQEGYVIRLSSSFSFDHFGQSVAKWVRPGHVQTNNHWSHSEIVPNRLRVDG
jgi:ATP-dependent RNA circularization protein (DNA/RNA ligase family)